MSRLNFSKSFFDCHLSIFSSVGTKRNPFSSTSISADVMLRLDKLTALLDTNFPTNLFEVLSVSQKFKSDVVSVFAVVSKFLCVGGIASFSKSAKTSANCVTTCTLVDEDDKSKGSIGVGDNGGDGIVADGIADLFFDCLLVFVVFWLLWNSELIFYLKSVSESPWKNGSQ